MTGQLLAVEVDLYLGLIVGTADTHLTHTIELEQFGTQVASHLVGRVEVVAVDLEVDGRLSTHARVTTGTYGILLYLRIAVEVGTNQFTNFEEGTLAFIRIYERDVERGDMATVVLHRGKGVVLAGLTYGVVDYAGLILEVGHPLLGQFLGDGMGTLSTSTYGHVHLHGHTAVVG